MTGIRTQVRTVSVMQAPASFMPLRCSASRAVNTIIQLLAPYTSQTASEAHRIVKYAQRYRLAFTLLNEDAASGQAAFSWDVREAVTGMFRPRSMRANPKTAQLICRVHLIDSPSSTTSPSRARYSSTHRLRSSLGLCKQMPESFMGSPRKISLSL